MSTAFIGLGANLHDPPGQIRMALGRIGCKEEFELQAVSSLYRSSPLGPADQPDYCNAVAQLQTSLSARASLQALLVIERAMGRQRMGERWGPRLIDLDLLLFGEAMIELPGLRVPHPEMHKRNFVMQPLAEIAPRQLVPGQGTAAELADALGSAGLALWETTHG